MKRRLAVIGATGAVGSTFAGHLLRSGLLQAGDELTLVGHGVTQSDSKLLAERIDLMDAFDEQGVCILFCREAHEVEADVVVVTAGVTVSAEHPTRRDLAAANIELFHHLAETCVARLPQAIFIVVSNPVELAVEIFRRKTSAARVIGMGAQQDSLRFARALAEKLGLHRNEVRASVLGEHGAVMFPVWSTVTLQTQDPEIHGQLAMLQQTCALESLEQRVTETRVKAGVLLASGDVQQAYELMVLSEPDVRIFIEPFITASVLHSTPNATSNATLQCVEAALSPLPRSIHGQVYSEGYLGVHGVCGLPVMLSRGGWQPVAGQSLNAWEQERLLACSRSITEAVQSAMDGEAGHACP